MGNQRQFNAKGGFSEYLYTSVSDSVIINGVKGRVIALADSFDNRKDNLPTYSNTSDIYFRKNMNDEVVQGKVYLSREMIMDFDWGHSHRNSSNGDFFPAGTIHVQVYKKDRNGHFVRLSSDARRMSDAEKEKYGPIIRHFNPNVIF